MNRFLWILAVTAAVSLAGYLACYELATLHSRTMLARPDCGMAWLRGEYHLSGVQFEKISQMHDDYRPTCERMCGKIAEANRKVRLLIAASPDVTPETEAAFREWALLQNECRVAMLRHVYAVSAVMNPEDGRRYLRMAAARIVEPGTGHMSLLNH